MCAPARGFDNSPKINVRGERRKIAAAAGGGGGTSIELSYSRSRRHRGFLSAQDVMDWECRYRGSRIFRDVFNYAGCVRGRATEVGHKSRDGVQRYRISPSNFQIVYSFSCLSVCIFVIVHL